MQNNQKQMKMIKVCTIGSFNPSSFKIDKTSPWKIKMKEKSTQGFLKSKIIKKRSLGEKFEKITCLVPEVSKMAKLVLGNLKIGICQIFPLFYQNLAN